MTEARMQLVLMILLSILVLTVIGVTATLILTTVFSEGERRTNALQLLEGTGGYVWQAMLLAIGYGAGRIRGKAT